MNRWLMLLVCAGTVMAGCQTEMATSEATGEVSQCFPGPGYCTTPAPQILPWQGQPPPVATAKQVYEVYREPLGDWVFALADTGLSKFVWVYRVKPANAGQLMIDVAAVGPIDGVRPPPPPPPVIDWNVYLMNRAALVLQIHPVATAAATDCALK